MHAHFCYPKLWCNFFIGDMDRTNDHKKLGLVVPRVTLALNQLLNKVQIGPELMTTLGLGCLQCLQLYWTELCGAIKKLLARLLLLLPVCSYGHHFMVICRQTIYFYDQMADHFMVKFHNIAQSKPSRYRVSRKGHILKRGFLNPGLQDRCDNFICLVFNHCLSVIRV